MEQGRSESCLCSPDNGYRLSLVHQVKHYIKHLPCSIAEPYVVIDYSYYGVKVSTLLIYMKLFIFLQLVYYVFACVGVL